MTRKIVPLRLIFLILAILGCVGEEVPRVERLADQYPAPWHIDFAELTGSRKGEKVEVTVLFLSPSDTLIVDLECRLTPECELVTGSFRAIDAGARIEGGIRPLSLTFQGGQGGRPAFGARLELVSESGGKLYRLNLPPTELRPVR